MDYNSAVERTREQMTPTSRIHGSDGDSLFYLDPNSILYSDSDLSAQVAAWFGGSDGIAALASGIASWLAANPNAMANAAVRGIVFRVRNSGELQWRVNANGFNWATTGVILHTAMDEATARAGTSTDAHTVSAVLMKLVADLAVAAAVATHDAAQDAHPHIRGLITAADGKADAAARAAGTAAAAAAAAMTAAGEARARADAARTVADGKVDPSALATEVGARQAGDVALGRRIDALEAGGGLDAEAVRAIVAAFIVGGTGITVTHDDANDRLTITNTVENTDTQLTPEQVQDIVAQFVRGGDNVTVTYDDTGNTLTIAATGGSTPTATTPVGTIGISPSTIGVYTSADGPYTLGAEDLDVAALNAANVDQYEIWFKDEAVHSSTGTWTPVADFTVDFNVSTSEETQIGLTSNDKIIPVRLVFRSRGQFVSLLNTWLEIGVTDQQFQEGQLRRAGDSIPFQPVDDADAFRTAVRAHAGGDQAMLLLLTSAIDVTFDAIRYNYPARQVVYFAERSGIPYPWFVLPNDATTSIPDGAVTTPKLAPNAVDDTRITARLQILSLHPSIDPVRGAMAGTYVIGFGDSGILPSGNAWYQVLLNGVPVTGRVQWTQPTNITVTPTTDQLTRMAAISTTDVSVVVAFYSARTGGSQLSQFRLDVSVSPEAQSWAQQGNNDPLPQGKIAALVQTLTSAAAIAWDTNKGLTANLVLGHNTVITPSGGRDGDTAILQVAQDATGGRTLAFAPAVRLGGRTVGLASAANSETYIALRRKGTTWVYLGAIQDA